MVTSMNHSRIVTQRWEPIRRSVMMNDVLPNAHAMITSGWATCPRRAMEMALCGMFIITYSACRPNPFPTAASITPP